MFNVCDNVLFPLFMGGNTTAITSLQKLFYVFDSHSREERRLNISNSRSVLLKFRYICEIEKYIQVAYLELEINSRCISKHNLLDSEQKLLICYPFFLNTRTVSGVKITKTIQLIFVKGKENLFWNHWYTFT